MFLLNETHKNTKYTIVWQHYDVKMFFMHFTILYSTVFKKYVFHLNELRVISI